MKQLTEEQIREWRPIIAGRVISLIGNTTPDWEDLTQDIMLSLTKAIKVFRRDADIGTLIYVVTMRRYYDYLRKKYKDKAIDCYLDYTTAATAKSPRRMRGPDTRIDHIRFMLKTFKLAEETRSLLEAVKKTLLSWR